MVVILLVLKLQDGRLVKAPLLLNCWKKLSPTVVRLLVSKLPAGRLVMAPSRLKAQKK